MRKRLVTQFALTILFLAAILFVLARKHDQHRPTTIDDLTRSAEAGSSVAEDHFSPAEDLERLDVQRLEQAKTSVDIAMYAFTDRYVADELKNLADRGVNIRIYRDQEQYEEEQRHASKRDVESTTSLLSGESRIQIRVKGHRELMHLKAYLIDGSVLRDGSANWSPSGEKRQDNNAHFTADPAQVASFQKDFEAMWKRVDNLKVQ